MKNFIKNIFRKFGLEISKYKSHDKNAEIESLKPEKENRGNVLLSYIIDPFQLKNGEAISNAHSHHGESLAIAQTFLDLGYSVDVISYLNYKYVPQKKYSFFIAARTNFQRIAELLNDDCIKIVHLDTAHWLYNNIAALRRCLALLERKGIALKSYKMCEQNYAIECADYATILGNQFTINTYNYAKKPVFRIPISSAVLYPWQENKNFEECKKHFLWLGSGGLIHKGLDLILDAFTEMPDYHLYICGPIEKEKDFEKAYRKELYQTHNIHTIGWVNIGGSEFIEIINKCIGLIYPSCSEGGGGSVINCMHAGLIPIVSYESSVDVDKNFGLILNSCSIEEIVKSIKSISKLPAQDLKQMSRRAWEFAQANHTLERFSEEYRKVIEIILNDSIQQQ